jgi:hypothetical protein
MNIDNGKSIENVNDIPEFYKEIITCWVEFGGGQTKTPTNFSSTYHFLGIVIFSRQNSMKNNI